MGRANPLRLVDSTSPLHVTESNSLFLFSQSLLRLFWLLFPFFMLSEEMAYLGGEF